jgi:predicted ATPase
MTEKENVMRNEIFIEIAGGRGAGKSRVLKELVTCLDALGADVIWRDAGPPVRKGARIGVKDGPLNDIRINLDTVDME